MTNGGRPRAVTIATIEPRVAAIVWHARCLLVRSNLVLDGPQWVRHAPRSAVVTYLVLVSAALVWGCVRGWRIALRIDQGRVTVRNFFRTHRVSLAEVSCFADGSAVGGESEHWWALCVVLRDGRAVTARGTTTASLDSGPRPTPRPVVLSRGQRPLLGHKGRGQHGIWCPRQ
jgi:hypothetical protein